MGLHLFTSTAELVSIVPHKSNWLKTISASKQLVADKISYLQELPLQARSHQLGPYSFDDIISGYRSCAEKLDAQSRLIQDVIDGLIDSPSMDRLEQQVDETRREIQTWESHMQNMLEILNSQNYSP